MAVWSKVKLSNLYGAFRWDAECYTPRMLRDQNALAKLETVKLGSVALVTDGQHGYHEVDEDSPVRHLTAKCVGPGVVVDKDADRLAMATHLANPESNLEVDDILLSTAGTIGEAGIVTAALLPANIDQDVARIKLAKDSPVHPYFVCAFLRSEYGQFQCERGTTGQIQGHINLTALRQFDIPVLAQQRRVVDVMRTGIKKYLAASDAIAAAEARLMEALGLDRLDLSPQKCYTRRFSDLEAEARFDAEYFNPKYQRIIKKLRAGGRTLADVAPLAQRPFDPALRPKGSTFRYIEIGSLTGDGEAEAESLHVADAPSRAAWIVKPGDIITSTVRPIRRLSAIVRDDQDGCVCSSGFACLTPKPGADGIEPEVLLTYLRLPIICEILDLHCTASMYPAIPEDRLMRIPIVVPDTKTRKAVVAKVQEAITARAEAAQLLEEAKQTVERMIAAR